MLLPFSCPHGHIGIWHFRQIMPCYHKNCLCYVGSACLLWLLFMVLKHGVLRLLQLLYWQFQPVSVNIGLMCCVLCTPSLFQSAKTAAGRCGSAAVHVPVRCTGPPPLLGSSTRKALPDSPPPPPAHTAVRLCSVVCSSQCALDTVADTVCVDTGGMCVDTEIYTVSGVPAEGPLLV